MFNKLANNLPNTNSLLDKWVISKRTSVRRSFSWDTALAANKAEKKIATTSCSGARIWNNMPPNRAKSPTSRTTCVPVTISHAMVISPSMART